MSAFTPGPWHVWNDTIYAGPFEKIKGGIRGYRAEICTVDDMDTEDDEREANARLIAAAPLLYAALERLAALYDTDEGCRSTPEYVEAMAALSAARGDNGELGKG